MDDDLERELAFYNQVCVGGQWVVRLQCAGHAQWVCTCKRVYTGRTGLGPCHTKRQSSKAQRAAEVARELLLLRRRWRLPRSRSGGLRQRAWRGSGRPTTMQKWCAGLRARLGQLHCGVHAG